MKQHKHDAYMEEMKTMKKNVSRTIPIISAVVKLLVKREQGVNKICTHAEEVGHDHQGSHDFKENFTPNTSYILMCKFISINLAMSESFF